jgi:hypothetical protein
MATSDPPFSQEQDCVQAQRRNAVTVTKGNKLEEGIIANGRSLLLVIT